MQENQQTPQDTSPSSTLSLCKKDCNPTCKKRKYETLDIDLPEPMKDEALCVFKVKPEYKRRKGIPEDALVGLDEDWEEDDISPFDFDLWLWENDFNLWLFDVLTKNEIPEDLPKHVKLDIVRGDRFKFRRKYSLLSRETTIDDTDWDVSSPPRKRRRNAK